MSEAFVPPEVAAFARQVFPAPKARGVIFGDHSVRAILAGEKDVTRRVGSTWARVKPGDRLWVREAHCWADQWWSTAGYDLDPPSSVAYRADLTAYAIQDERPAVQLDTKDWGWGLARWRSPIHMPRWASRLTLQVASVRTEQSHRDGPWYPLPLVDDAEARREGFVDRSEFIAAWDEMHPDYDGPVYRIAFKLVGGT